MSSGNRPLGPAAMAAQSRGKLDQYGGSSSIRSGSGAGLVIMDPSKNPSVRGPSKHIQKMVETSQTNEKFKNLLKVKIADREKEKAEKEFGSKPEEFVTSAYLKKRDESLKLGRDLESQERTSEKRDVTNMFRHMLGTGSFARSNYVPVSGTVNADAKRSKPVEITKGLETTLSEEVPKELVEKVLSRVVPESANDVARAIERKAHQDTFRIIEQIEQVESVDRDEAIKSAKERYLERKRQKLQ
jgi:hypothetical protein